MNINNNIFTIREIPNKIVDISDKAKQKSAKEKTVSEKELSKRAQTSNIYRTFTEKGQYVNAAI